MPEKSRALSLSGAERPGGFLVAEEGFWVRRFDGPMASLSGPCGSRSLCSFTKALAELIKLIKITLKIFLNFLIFCFKILKYLKIISFYNYRSFQTFLIIIFFIFKRSLCGSHLICESLFEVASQLQVQDTVCEAIRDIKFMYNKSTNLESRINPWLFVRSKMR